MSGAIWHQRLCEVLVGNSNEVLDLGSMKEVVLVESRIRVDLFSGAKKEKEGNDDHMSG